MASIRSEIVVETAPERVWDAVRDFGAPHVRLAPGFLLDSRLEEGARVVTFFNGMVVRELVVDVDDEARRLVWAAVGGSLSHHNASMQVFPETGGRSRLVWIADLLPDAATPGIRALIDQAMATIKPTLERAR